MGVWKFTEEARNLGGIESRVRDWVSGGLRDLRVRGDGYGKGVVRGWETGVKIGTSECC